MKNLLTLFKSWKTLYIERLEKENERLLLEVRHWQNQCLMGMRMQPLPTSVGSEAPRPPSEGMSKMPQMKTFHERQRKDNLEHDKQWAINVVGNELELKRAREEQEKLSKNGVSH